MAEINGRNYGVLVIDMQDIFLEAIWYLKVRRLIANQGWVLEFCAEKDIPVANIRTVKKGPIAKGVLESLNKVPRVETVSKDREDGFTKGLRLQLKEWSVSHLCVMGVYASYCVLETSRSARKNDLEIVTSKDLIGDRRYGKSDDSWYIENGLYFKRTVDLIDHMSSD